MTCSPRTYPRWLRRARTSPVSMTPSGRWLSVVAATASPCASGHYCNLPPYQWACARTGSKGQKKNLSHLSASLFSLHGTSPDVPVVRYTQILWRTTTFAEILARQELFCAATCLQQRTRQIVCMRRGRRIDLSRPNFENYTVVASALVAESGRRVRLKPGCPIRACRFKSCRAH
jgi:hypothetical protein